MAEFWDEPKDTAAIDRYSLTIDTDWLEGEAILTSIWSVESGSGLTFDTELIIGNVVSASFIGGDIGNWCVEAKITTATRNKTFCGTIVIRDCC